MQDNVLVLILWVAPDKAHKVYYACTSLLLVVAESVRCNNAGRPAIVPLFAH